MTAKERMEKIGSLKKQLADIVGAAKTENRAVTDDETAEFEKVEMEIRSLEKTAELEKRAFAATATATDEAEPEQRSEPEQQKQRYSAVNAYIRGSGTELRADADGVITTNDGIIATDYSDDVIHNVMELSGIIDRIGIVNSRGNYDQIVADSENKITAGWTSELAEVTSSEAQFKTITIGHHKLGSLFKASYEVVNQNYFDIATEAINQMSQDFALKAETAIIKGSGEDQPTGLTSSGTAYIMGSSVAITADDVIKIYHSLKAPYQINAAWIMSNNTLCAIRLLTDTNGQYLFHQNDLTTGYAGTLLGKPVLVSEAMDEIGSGTVPILFGDFARAYKANISPDVSIQVLREKYATQGCIGILGFMFIDGKPINAEAYVAATCAADAVEETTE